MGLLTKRVYKILSAVMAAIMLIAVVCAFAASGGGPGNLPRELLIGITAASGAVAVFAARKGWKP